MSKYHFTLSEIYYPNSDIPKNRLNIKDPLLLHEIEAQLLYDAMQYFVANLTENIQFDEKFFKNLHKTTFQSLYEWAGLYRDIDMAKGDSLFCRGEFVGAESKRIFAALKEENYLKGINSREQLAQKIAFYQCELIALHPFYELNGRITRLYFDLIAIYNGFLPIDYSVATVGEYIDASIECVQKADCKKLFSIIYKGLKK